MKYLNLLVLSAVMTICTFATSHGQSAALQSETQSIKTTSIKVKGITCGVDLKMITANVEKIEGVTTCKVKKKGRTSTLNVTFDASIVDESDIHAAIEDTGGCKDPNARPYKVKL